MELAVDYELRGCANNAPICVTGQGHADPESGRCEMTLEATRVAMQWDSVLLVLGGLDGLLLSTARRCRAGSRTVDLPDDLPILVGSRVDILDDQGREMGRAKLSGHLSRRGRQLTKHVQYLEASLRFEALEQVTRTDAPCASCVMPIDAMGVLLTSAFTFETNRGNAYRAFVSTRISQPDDSLLSGLHVLTVRSFELDRELRGHPSGFSLRIEAAVDPLAVSS